MQPLDWFKLLLYCSFLLALAWPLGQYMARVYSGDRVWLSPLIAPLERLLYRMAGVPVTPDGSAQEMRWQQYAWAILVFNALGLLAVYLLQRIQGILPLNPADLPAVSADSAFNTAISFASNTNWQGYSGETTMSYLTQMLGLSVQNFLSAATGMAVLIAFIRGFTRRSSHTIGNFWVDLSRSILFILLPLSVALAILLVSQGVVQTIAPPAQISDLAHKPGEHSPQSIPLGPAASQVAIKQLGTNGGGFYSVNSAHPLENPTPLTNWAELLAILLIPVALCFTFGRMAGDTRQGWGILAAMFTLFLPLVVLCAWQERSELRQYSGAGITSESSGNMEGKEVRFGVFESALWACATTAASNGSVNAMHDSFTPLGGLAPLMLMQLSEVVFGGVGCGLYGMLVYAIVAVFIAGLMVGRTPEYLGKKIEPFEMKMASLIILIPPSLALLGAALAVATVAGQASVFNPGAHGFTEVLYNVTSAANNNGSAFGGMSTNTPFYNLLLGVLMFISRYWLVMPLLALAGSLAAKKHVPPSAGTLPTHGTLFAGLLAGVVLLVGVLNFVPALALGPVAEQMHLVSVQQGGGAR